MSAAPQTSTGQQPVLPAEVAGALSGMHPDAAGAELAGRSQQVLMRTYGAPQRVLVRGEGAYVWDADGRRYLDLLAGIATNSLGHAHPALVAAVTAQMATLGHVSNFFVTGPQVALAERLLQLARAPQGSRVFFCSSGAEANEAAFKMARRTGRPTVIAAHGGFHGRTMGALALTSKQAYRQPFEPLPGGVVHVPFGDVEALRAVVDDTVAAVVLEAVQGEGGVVVAPPGYLAAARRLCTEHGALLVLDEVQTGIGRTGAWFAHQHDTLGDPVVPDVLTMAKGLGGGFPVGAVVGFGPAGDLLGAGSHGTTFGGNPVACVAALTVLHVIERDDLLAGVRSVGRALREGIEGLGHPLVQGVRGQGLLLGVALERPLAAEVVRCALDAGFLVNAVAPDTVRLAPPLILTADQARELLDALPAVLDAALSAAAGGRS